MALESKPLFHPEVLRQQVRAFNLPERVADWQPKLQHWAELIFSGRADDFKKSALLPDFLTDIFCGLLGYTGPVGPADTHNSHNSHNPHLSTTVPAASANTFTLFRERHVEVDGKVADAVLGRFQKGKEQFVAVLEGIYVYFYELGLRLLKPGGLLSFIVTNKWMKAGYGEPLRRFFSEKACVRPSGLAKTPCPRLTARNASTAARACGTVRKRIRKVPNA
jgi:hypothetical protein